MKSPFGDLTLVELREALEMQMATIQQLQGSWKKNDLLALYGARMMKFKIEKRIKELESAPSPINSSVVSYNQFKSRLEAKREKQKNPFD